MSFASHTGWRAAAILCFFICASRGWAQPDLLVAELVPGEVIRSGERFQIEFRLRILNAGGAAVTGPIRMSVFCGFPEVAPMTEEVEYGSGVPMLSGLRAGATASLTTSATLPVGRFAGRKVRFQACADTDLVIRETNETNNCSPFVDVAFPIVATRIPLEKSIPSAPPAMRRIPPEASVVPDGVDLWIEEGDISVSVADSGPGAGAASAYSVTLKAVVHNLGGRSEPGPVLAQVVLIDDRGNPYSTTTAAVPSPVEARGAREFTQTGRIARPDARRGAAWRVRVSIDPEHRTADTRFDNNTAEKSFVIPR